LPYADWTDEFLVRAIRKVLSNNPYLAVELFPFNDEEKKALKKGIPLIMRHKAETCKGVWRWQRRR
jgi:MinD-like ATPase involved in chromosome partitioning or flagellar assembly